MTEQQLTLEMLMELYEYDNKILQLNEDEMNQHINQFRGHIEFCRQEIRVQNNQIKEEKAAQQEAEKRLQQQIQLPMMICTVSELFVMEDEDTRQKLECVIIKTSSRQNVFCSSPGLIQYSEMKPNELIAVHKDSFLIYERLPQFYDARVKQTLVAEKPKDSFADIGGMDAILQQVQEAVILPFQRPELFEEIGIKPSKGLLLWGAPGVGKTLIARAIAHECNCIFFSLCATQLIHMFIGDGSSMIQEIFELAKEYVDNDTINGVPQNTPKEQLRGALIYIDEIDAIGTRRHDSDNKEIGRTLMTLLNLMDGFISNNRIKVIASTNRIDQLDPALVRSNRFDRKIECTVPNQAGRVKILQIHSAKMKLAPEASLEEVAKACDQFSGAQLKQVCIEAGMQCMRRNGVYIEMHDFMEGVQVVLNRTNQDHVGYL